ncbi:hypothetical protein [Lysobacter hankyongensis]|uniref:Uncharacterized protein n=1 Tax=Lysobacter hankyongensis TaxID=1176535 RepID=A0ABP9B9D6_9GAMM
MQPQDPDIVSDLLIVHHAHMLVCAAVLNFTQVSEVLLDLQRRIPNAEPELLLRAIQQSYRNLIDAHAASLFITENADSRDLTSVEAIEELQNPACWHPGGRYLAASKVPGTSYFEEIYEKLLSYARCGYSDA